MKKTLTLLLFVPVILFGQNLNFKKRCMSNDLINFYEQKYPGYKELVDQSLNDAKSLNRGLNESEVFEIPVVFHVLYNAPEQNLDESIVTRQLEILNEDYRRTNADTSNLREEFNDIKSTDSKIKFKFANSDPQGNPTNGIIRKSTTLTSFANFAALLGDLSSIERVKSSADGGDDPWDQSRYLNIWICNMAIPLLGPSILGYATPPANLPNWPAGGVGDPIDGVVLQFQIVGDNNPNTISAGGGEYVSKGRTAVHEVGHYLGLRHIWGDDTNCAGNDGIDDTPSAADQSDTDCDTTKNTCVDNINGVDLPDMIENYMDYSAETCQNSFTRGQVDLMRSVIQNQRVLLSSKKLAFSTNFSVTVYPNPSSNSINVNTPNVLSAYKIFSVDGRLIKSEINFNSKTIDLIDLTKGVYLLELSDKTGYLNTSRIIKE
ncbi:MAG: zinc-dependent metalloprotease [Bacteroidia bacterium]